MINTQWMERRLQFVSLLVEKELGRHSARDANRIAVLDAVLVLLKATLNKK